MILIYHYYIAGTFFPRAGALIGYFEVTRHLTIGNRTGTSFDDWKAHGKD